MTKPTRYAVVHASTPGGNPRECLMGWYTRQGVEPSYGSYAEALVAAQSVSRAHGNASAQVVRANARGELKLTAVYGPMR